MPAINLYESYKNKTRKFGVNDSPRFRDSFAEAVNLVHSELNDQVFGEGILPMLTSFDDVIDKRLAAFSSLAFDAGHRASIGGREFWSVEYSFEVLSSTNGFTDTILLSDATEIKFSILNGVFSISSPFMNASAELPATTSMILLFSSNRLGNRLLLGGGLLGLEHPPEPEILLTAIPGLDWDVDLDMIPGYTSGSSASTISIGTVAGRSFSGISGLEMKRTRFYSAESIIADFRMSEGTGTEIIDSVSGDKGVVSGGRWIELYTGIPGLLDERYRSVLDMGLDYHLQDGGEWAIEPDQERERKWYVRGIRMGRTIHQSMTAYHGPLGIE
jgi:hypothetical protein